MTTTRSQAKDTTPSSSAGRVERLDLATLVAALSFVLVCVAVSNCGGGPAQNSQSESGDDAPLNVLILLLDTTRADRLSAYGYARELTPAIDRLASEGVLFSRFYSNSSWTLPAHASLFTGLYPVAHRATQETLELGNDPPTMAEIFTQAGYATFASSSNGVVNQGSGLARGFEEFVEVFRPKVRDRYKKWRRHANNVALERFLDEGRGEQPFFAFLNYIDAHLPYQPPKRFRRRWVRNEFDSDEVEAATWLGMKSHYLLPAGLSKRQLEILSDLYDAEIAYLDDQIGHVVEMLDERGLLDETLIILTADHGENLGEHGHLAHVFSVYNTLLHIPLIVRFPDGARAATVRSDVAQLVDLFPTVLRQAGLAEAPNHGRDLFAARAAEVSRPALSEYYYPRQVLSVFTEEELEEHGPRFLPFMQRWRAIQDDRFKLIEGSAGITTLYDLGADPHEERPLPESGPWLEPRTRLLEALHELVETLQGTPPLDPAPPPGWLLPGFEATIDDPEVLEQLRELGYVH